MMEPTNLRDCLAILFPLHEDIRRLASDTGFPVAKLATGTALHVWHELLCDCHRRGRLQNLPDVAIME